MRDRTIAILAGGLVVAIGAGAWFGPFLLRERTVIAATPSPAPFLAVTPVTVEAGSEVCLDQIVFTPDTEVALFALGEQRGPVPPLRFSARGSGGSYEAVESRSAQQPRPEALRFAFTPPADGEVAGTVCLENLGTRPLELIGGTEARTISRTQARIDGEPIEPEVALTLFEADSSSYLSRAGEILERATAFKPLVGTWFTYPLALLLLVLVPVAPLWALWRALSAGAGRTAPPRGRPDRGWPGARRRAAPSRRHGR